MLAEVVGASNEIKSLLSLETPGGSSEALLTDYSTRKELLVFLYYLLEFASATCPQMETQPNLAG